MQDIYMNKTGLYADVILPATAWGENEGIYTCADRGFQRVRKLIEPEGDMRPDWQIIADISTAMGYPMNYKNTEEIWNEMIDLCPSFTGATYEKLKNTAAFSGPAGTNPRRIREHRISIRTEFLQQRIIRLCFTALTGIRR